MADGDVAHDARRIVVVRATVFGARVTRWQNLVDALNLLLGGVVRHCVAQKDDAAPQAAVFVRQQVRRGNVVLHRREDDGHVWLAHGVDLAAFGHHQGRGVNTLAILGLYYRSGFNVQLGTVFDDDQATEDIYIVVGPVDRFAGVDVSVGHRDRGTAFHIVGLGQHSAGRESDHDQ